VRNPVHVFVHAPDPVSQAGLTAQLRNRPGISVVEDPHAVGADVALVSLDVVDDAAVRVVRAVQRTGCQRVLALVIDVDEASLLRLVEEGVVGIVRRGEASPERLADAVLAARDGGGHLPTDLLGGLLRQMKHVHDHVLSPRGLHFHGLTHREIEVMRLVAEGYDTQEIAAELSYSQRTIKNVIHDVVCRFGLRNRSHAVAFAVRQGLI
jgi:DNA-binding NarL/FixJ family response regulator